MFTVRCTVNICSVRSVNICRNICMIFYTSGFRRDNLYMKKIRTKCHGGQVFGCQVSQKLKYSRSVNGTLSRPSTALGFHIFSDQLLNCYDFLTVCRLDVKPVCDFHELLLLADYLSWFLVQSNSCSPVPHAV